MALIVSNLVLANGSLLWQYDVFHPLIVVLSAFVFYTGLSLLLMLASKVIQFKLRGRSLKLRFLSLTLIVSGIFAVINKNDGHYDINTIPHHLIKPADRPELTVFFDSWLGQRKDLIKEFIRKGKKFPIVVVSSEGGGSRAALWSLLINSYLQKENPNYFNKHLFAFTNASGGGTGNSMFFCFMTHGTSPEKVFRNAGGIFTRDYLSSSLSLLLGFDSIQGVFGLNIVKGRAQMLEREWEVGMKEISQDIEFDRPFLQYWANNSGSIRTDLPLLFLNTTSVQKGNHAITAPIKMDQKQFPNADDMLSMIDTLTGKTIGLATATLLNARFPFVNPVGSIPETPLQFGDAGYYDNYGAENAVNVINALKEHIRLNYPELLDSVEFVSVVIENSSVEKNSDLKTKSQIWAPINTLIKVRSANSMYALKDLKRTTDVYYKFSLSLAKISLDDNDEVKVIPGIPLARHLSKVSARAIMQSCLDEKTGSFSKLNAFLGRLDPNL